MRATTLGELGASLPIGVVDGKVLKKDFTLRPYKSWVDRTLGLWREANQGKHIALLVAKYMSLVVESAGGVTYPLTTERDSLPAQEFAFHGWWYADVMYAYLYSRVQTVGSKIAVPYSCPMRTASGPARCDAAGIKIADLNSIEVDVAESPSELEVWVDLTRGFQLRKGQTCKKLKLRPIKFRAQMLAGSGAVGVDSVGYNHFRDAVCAVDCIEGEYVLIDQEIDEIEKIDTLRVDRQANKVAAGASLRTHLDCPKCGAKIVNALDWDFDSFFDSSVPGAALMS